MSLLSCSLPFLYCVGFRNEPPQDVPQWHAGYFDLKATDPAGSRETLLPCFNVLEEFELVTWLIIEYYQR